MSPPVMRSPTCGYRGSQRSRAQPGACLPLLSPGAGTGSGRLLRPLHRLRRPAHLERRGLKVPEHAAVQGGDVHATRDEAARAVDGDGLEGALDAIEDGAQNAGAQLHRQGLHGKKGSGGGQQGVAAPRSCASGGALPRPRTLPLLVTGSPTVRPEVSSYTCAGKDGAGCQPRRRRHAESPRPGSSTPGPG